MCVRALRYDGSRLPCGRRGLSPPQGSYAATISKGRSADGARPDAAACVVCVGARSDVDHGAARLSLKTAARAGDCAMSENLVCTKTGASKCLSVFFSCLLVDDDKAVRWIPANVENPSCGFLALRRPPRTRR